MYGKGGVAGYARYTLPLVQTPSLDLSQVSSLPGKFHILSLSWRDSSKSKYSEHRVDAVSPGFMVLGEDTAWLRDAVAWVWMARGLCDGVDFGLCGKVGECGYIIVVIVIVIVLCLLNMGREDHVPLPLRLPIFTPSPSPARLFHSSVSRFTFSRYVFASSLPSASSVGQWPERRRCRFRFSHRQSGLKVHPG